MTKTYNLYVYVEGEENQVLGQEEDFNVVLNAVRSYVNDGLSVYIEIEWLQA